MLTNRVVGESTKSVRQLTVNEDGKLVHENGDVDFECGTRKRLDQEAVSITLSVALSVAMIQIGVMGVTALWAVRAGWVRRDSSLAQVENDGGRVD